MKFLLDTHVWLWSLLEPTKLNAITKSILIDPANTLFLSPISVWETLILIEKKRIQVNADPITWVTTALRHSHVHEAVLTHAVAMRSRQIQLPHQDPADRFIAATAIEYALTLLTADEHLLKSAQITTIAAN